MFSHDTASFKLVCTYLFGRTWANNTDEVRKVVEEIKLRRAFIKTFKRDSEIFKKLENAYGFNQESYLEGGEGAIQSRLSKAVE